MTTNKKEAFRSYLDLKNQLKKLQLRKLFEILGKYLLKGMNSMNTSKIILLTIIGLLPIT